MISAWHSACLGILVATKIFQTPHSQRKRSFRRLRAEPNKVSSAKCQTAWEKIVSVAPPQGSFLGWVGALEEDKSRQLGAAAPVYYAVDPALKWTGEVGRRTRKKLGLSVWKDFVDDLRNTRHFPQWQKGTWKKLEREEKELALELGRLEVLMGPIMEVSTDGGVCDIYGQCHKLLGFFKVYAVPTGAALAGGFIDRSGDWWPLRDEAMRAWELLEESGMEIAELASAPLTVETLFSKTPGIESYDSLSSAALAERLSKIVELSPRKARRKRNKRDKLQNELLQEITKESLTPADVKELYGLVDVRLTRSGQQGFIPDSHTRNVYNMVADVIFSQAQADIEPYILKNVSVPRAIVERYVMLRDVNKRLALARTSASSASSIAARNMLKYNDTRGPGENLEALIASKGATGAVLGSFATRGRDLLLWGNKAGYKIDTWRWLNGSVASPWHIKESQVQAFKDSELARVFGTAVPA